MCVLSHRVPEEEERRAHVGTLERRSEWREQIGADEGEERGTRSLSSAASHPPHSVTPSATIPSVGHPQAVRRGLAFLATQATARNDRGNLNQMRVTVGHVTEGHAGNFSASLKKKLVIQSTQRQHHPDSPTSATYKYLQQIESLLQEQQQGSSDMQPKDSSEQEESRRQANGDES